MKGVGGLGPSSTGSHGVVTVRFTDVLEINHGTRLLCPSLEALDRLSLTRSTGSTLDDLGPSTTREVTSEEHVDRDEGSGGTCIKEGRESLV